MQAHPTDLLRDHGLQVTAQRIAVLRAVTARPHSTAETVTEAARAEIGAISRQAVYDALRVLTEKGLIRRIHPDGSSALYDPRVHDNHHHVICRHCGAAVDVDCSFGEESCSRAAADSDYQIDQVEVIYWGTCPACAEGTSGMKAQP